MKKYQMVKRKRKKRIIGKCTVCGTKLTHDRYGDLCQSCYMYFKAGGVIYPLPPKGEIHRNDRGEVICHICGKAYSKLGSHVANSHHISASDYKKRFGLAKNAGLCTPELKLHLRAVVMGNYEKIVVDNLIKKGEATRIKKGEVARNKNKISLQTKRELQERARHLRKRNLNNEEHGEQELCGTL